MGKDRLGADAVLVGAWLIATLAAGSITWAAVATFGRDGGPASSHVLSQADVRRQLVGGTPGGSTAPAPTAPAPTAVGPTTASGSHHGHHVSIGPTQGGPSASGSGTPPTTQGVDPPPTESPTGTPSTGGTSEAPPTRHASSPSRAQSRSWTFDGGRAGATCLGDSITSFYATPEDGWTYAVLDNEPQRVALRFHEVGDDSATMLTARCVTGAPAAQIGGATGYTGDDGKPTEGDD